MAEHFPLMVPGARSDEKHAEVRSPYDGQVIGTVERTDLTGVQMALETAHGLFRDPDAWLSPGERIAILERTAAIMHERLEELAVEAAREGGKPLIDSRVEANRAVDSIKSCVEHLRTQAGTEIPMSLNPASSGRLAFTRHEPMGVVVAFCAFNHPLTSWRTRSARPLRLVAR